MQGQVIYQAGAIMYSPKVHCFSGPLTLVMSNQPSRLDFGTFPKNEASGARLSRPTRHSVSLFVSFLAKPRAAHFSFPELLRLWLPWYSVRLHRIMEQRYPEWQNVKGTQHPAADDSVFDAAWAYLNEHRGALGTADLKQLRWKIDKRLLPFLSLCYLVQFLDKVVYNVGNVLTQVPGSYAYYFNSTLVLWACAKT
jgi:hypothetical protein